MSVETQASVSFHGEFAEIVGPIGNIVLPNIPQKYGESPPFAERTNRYRVSFVLAIPKMSTIEDGWPIGSDPGDLHLILVNEQGESLHGYSVRPVANLPVHFYLIANAAKRLGRLTSDDFTAEIFETATRWANDSVNAVLSDLCVFNDIPIQVKQIEVFNLTDLTYWSRRRLPFVTREMGFRSNPYVSIEFRLFANLYREALSSLSEAYRLLCLYKLFEALLAYRGRIAKKTKKSGDSPIVYREIIPEKLSEQLEFLKGIVIVEGSDHEFLEQIFPLSVRGWKFRRALNEIRPTRDKIAHALLDNGSLGLSTDSLETSRQVTFWLPLLRVLCRKIFQEDFGVGV